jgi:hypothetical protein
MYYIKYLTSFEQYYAHLQEVKIIFLQHLVSSFSVSGRAVHRLRADCSPLSTGALYRWDVDQKLNCFRSINYT